MNIVQDGVFINKCSSYLEGFQQVNDYTYRFMCPYDCGDSIQKRRGYLYKDQRNDVRFQCHNCGTNRYLRNFLKDVHAPLYEEYMFSSFGTKSKTHIKHKEKNLKKIEEEKCAKFSVNNNTFLDCPSLATVGEDNVAQMYAVERMIPRRFFGKLFYCDDFYSLALKFGYGGEQLDKLSGQKNVKKLIIPFFDQFKEVDFLQARSLDEKDTIRYIALKSNPKALKVFGLDRLNPNIPKRVVEGPIDSLFVENCIAVGDSNLDRALDIIGDCVLIFDNQPRNKNICHAIKKAIDKGCRVCLMPENLFNGKDINDIVKQGYDLSQIENAIKKYTYSGLEASLRFGEWKKV